MNGIETRLVCGFLDAGKTSYICDCIRNDYFHKYGTTLILCFEQGEEAYDEAFLAERRTFAAYHEEGQDVRALFLIIDQQSDGHGEGEKRRQGHEQDGQGGDAHSCTVPSRGPRIFTAVP